jgi:hypothetical protein
LIFRYDYFWSREAAAGRDQGKERPPVWSPRWILSPRRALSSFCRSPPPPDQNTVGVAIPAKVGRALGLDDAPSWVIVSEHNVDEWPNAGLAPVPGRPGLFSYGFIPPGLFATVKAKFLEQSGQGRRASVRR